MNINKYLCNLKQSYLALIMTSTINQITKRGPSLKDIGLFYTLFRVDTDAGLQMSKVISVNTLFKTETKLFGITDIDVFVTGLSFSPIITSLYNYNETKEILELGYQVML